MTLNKMMLVSDKGQISTEYLLIMLAVVASLSFIVYEASTLYEKNIIAIDNREFKETCQWLKDTIAIFELQPNAKASIETKPLKSWTIEQTTIRSITLNNQTNECIIDSNYKINTIEMTIKGKTKVILEKKNNNIYLDVEEE